jgi:hypothetical protein
MTTDLPRLVRPPRARARPPRASQVTTPEGADVPSAVPGTADLTFKMKKVDPNIGAGTLRLPPAVGPAKLTAKVENDVHCERAGAGRPWAAPRLPATSYAAGHAPGQQLAPPTPAPPALTRQGQGHQQGCPRGGPCQADTAGRLQGGPLPPQRSHAPNRPSRETHTPRPSVARRARPAPPCRQPHAGHHVAPLPAGAPGPQHQHPRGRRGMVSKPGRGGRQGSRRGRGCRVRGVPARRPGGA